MDKKTIVHIIYNFTRGGAETMMVQVIKKLPAYRHIVVTLQENNHFKGELECDEYVCLDTPSIWMLPLAAIRFRKFLKSRKVDLVHSHLPFSNFTARLGTPANIPLITTIHTAISAAVDYKKGYIRFLDRFTYAQRPSTIVAVSQQALNDYFLVLNIKKRKGPAMVIHTFVDMDRFSGAGTAPPANEILLMSIGSLRKNKNHDQLIKAMGLLKEEPVSLHIYGQGPARDELQLLIADTGAKVILKGEIRNIPELMAGYHIFVMASRFEGFSLSVLEAMAAKRPMLLSNIPSFREQCEDCALYFGLDDPGDLAHKIRALMADPAEMEILGNKGFYRMSHNFTLKHYLQQLTDLYEKEMPRIKNKK